MAKGAAVFGFALLAVFCHVALALPATRRRRSDDSDPLEAVVNGLSQQLTQLTAQLQAQDQQITELKARLDNTVETRLSSLETPVAFTARSSKGDVTGLSKGQTIMFDQVLYNAGGGFDPSTSFFTAPSAGTYAFFLQAMAHYSEQTSELQIFKGSLMLANVFNCCTGDAANSVLATVHLDKGDTVHVQMARGSSFYGGPFTAFSGMKLAPM